MTVPLLIVRPEPGASRTLATARDMGLNAAAFPLFAVRATPWEPVPRGGIDALLLGSANALRHAGPGLALYRGVPAYCVGETTASAAQEAGLAVVAIGRGGLQSLIDVFDPLHRRLLRLAGRERVTLEVSPPFSIVTREVYASESQPAPSALLDALRRPAVVLLHSAEAAAHFAQVCDDAGIGRSHISLAVIGPRVAARAESGWAHVASAARPDDVALLALAARMCQDMSSGQRTPTRT